MISKRRYCQTCELPEASCICYLGCPVDNRVELLVLQHPLEQNESKNSLRLLKICAKNVRFEIGETFSNSELQEWLNTGDKTSLLLYPPTPEIKALGIDQPAPLPDLDQLTPECLRLVLLDATWKKSRKMLYLNPPLQKLPRLTLVDPPPSIYHIRKAHSENQLSSLEACCYAWRQLEKNPLAYQNLLEAFAGFVNQQKSLIEKKPL
jgi:DTW domain-containing protein YfiP